MDESNTARAEVQASPIARPAAIAARTPPLPLGLAERAAPRFRVYSDREMAEEFARAPEDLVAGILEKRSLTMISGPPSSGKTAMLMAVGIAASEARPLAGHFETKKAKVLFIGFEASSFSYNKQYRRLLAGHELDGTEIGFVFGHGQDLMDDAVARDFRATVREGDFDLVLIDGLNAMSSAEENSNTEMDRILHLLVTLVSEGCTVVFTHHTGKGVDGRPGNGVYSSRGASAIPARVDVEWRASLEKDGKLTLENVKSRGTVERGTRHLFTLAWDAKRITLTANPDGDGLEAILAQAIRQAPNGLTRGQLVELARPLCEGVSSDALEQRVKRALMSLRIRRDVNHAGQGKPYVWSGGVERTGT